MIFIKSDAELALMRRAGRIVAQTLDLARESLRPGITTADLDLLVDTTIRRHGAIPSFQGLYDFPASACISVNEELVHGIPGPRVLHEGDIVTIDAGAMVNGYHADGAWTFPVGAISPGVQQVLDVAQGALDAGIALVQPDELISTITRTVQAYVESRGMSIARKYHGHGVGRSLHEPPNVPNWTDPKGRPPRRVRLKPGMTITIEPVVIRGDWQTEVRPDKWTVVARDGTVSAHFEHSLVVTEQGAEILTAL